MVDHTHLLTAELRLNICIWVSFLIKDDGSGNNRVSTSLDTGDNVGVLVDEELLLVELHLLTAVLRK